MQKQSSHYRFLDSGNGRKLEQFGEYILDRPCSTAVWKKSTPDLWESDALFEREGGKLWKKKPHVPTAWNIEIEGICFRIAPTDFGHLGIFPEQRPFWKWIRERVRTKKAVRVLNLFAYSGGSTMAAAQGGAHVVHLDASKGMVSWAKENALLNNLEKAPIRWIVDDAQKFLQREVRRKSRYDAIILDPPTFGRGNKGELFKIEEHIVPLLERCRDLLSDTPLFVLFSCHTPGFSPIVMHNLMKQTFGGGSIDCGEMVVAGEALPIPSGTFARLHYD